MPLADNWTPYTPEDKSPWNLRRVVHLHRRAGFAATWNEIERDLKDGPKVSVDRVLSGKAATEGVPEKFEEIAEETLGPSAAASRDPARLKAWWVYRMMFGPDPLAERLALMWHNHFATSNLKVENLARMRAQNVAFRKLGRKHFAELLNAVIREPATLVWLDAPANRKGQPNENLARELMELFSMGIGNYTEADVKEAARALTGWTVVDDEKPEGGFAENEKGHDDGEKTILGKKGKWKGADLVRMVLENPATSKRIAGRFVSCSSAKKPAKAPISRLWHRDCASGTSTSPGPSRPCCARNYSSRTKTSTTACWGRWSTSSERPGRWSCSIRRRARWCWRSGAADSGRTCFIRPTSAAGRAADRG
jgi:hypothetical protein